MEKLNVFNYSIQNSADHLDVYIDGIIVDAATQQIMRDYWGDETSVSFKSIRDQVNKSGLKNINFWLNSYGGHCGDAMAMHDWIGMMDNDPSYNITTNGLGMVCSSTTYILSAAKKSNISKNSWYMIHNVSGGVYGDVVTCENYVRVMRKFNDVIENYYANLTGKDNATVAAWMNAETWFTGEEAVAYGFVKNLLNSGNENFKNTISPDLFPYKNTAALSLYNSFVKPEGDNENNFNLNLNNVNAFVKAIVDAFKADNFFAPAKEGDKPTPLTEENMTNSLNKAFESLDVSEMVNNSINEMFKDGLPENILNALTTSMGTAMDEKLKNLATSESVTKVSEELENVKKDVLKNAGTAGKIKKDPENNADEKFAHDGVTWGQEDNDAK